jgi:hypothetical protein
LPPKESEGSVENAYRNVVSGREEATQQERGEEEERRTEGEGEREEEREERRRGEGAGHRIGGERETRKEMFEVVAEICPHFFAVSILSFRQ